MTTLREQLAIDEGKRKSAYQDSEGYWTIGIGRLIDAKLGGGLSEEEIQYLLTNDIYSKTQDCKKLFPKFSEFSLPRQDALVMLMFNIGLTKISGYKTFVAQVNAQDWVGVQENLKSWTKWRAQVGARADRITKMFEV